MPCALKLRKSSLPAATEIPGHERERASAFGVDLVRLRSVLHPAPQTAEFLSDDGAVDQGLTPASVLFPIVLRAHEPTVLLTLRTEHLKDHPGQISFPGGRAEPGDASAAHTALREAEEEIGLSSVHVEILGYLPEYRTVTGFRVTPVVALVKPPFELRPDSFEVADVFEVPLAFLLNPANHQRHSLELLGKPRQFFAMTYQERFIWGATAAMIVSLSRAMVF